MRRYIPGAACWGSTAPKLPVHRRSPARCTSRRWRLLACPYWAGRGRPAGRPSESARLPQAVPPPACGWWVSALFERVGKENGAPRSSPDAPASVPSCWLITAFPACVILPQMNHQPMCIWMVKPPFTQYISRNTFLSVRFFRVIPTDRLGRTLGGARSAPDTFLSGLGDQPCPARLFVGAVTWDGWG